MIMIHDYHNYIAPIFLWQAGPYQVCSTIFGRKVVNHWDVFCRPCRYPKEPQNIVKTSKDIKIDQKVIKKSKIIHSNQQIYVIYIYTTSAMILLLKLTSMYGDFTAIEV